LVGVAEIIKEGAQAKIDGGVGGVYRSGLKSVAYGQVGRALGVGNEGAVNGEKVFPDGNIVWIKLGRDLAGIDGSLGKVGTGGFFFGCRVFLGEIGIGDGEVDLGKSLGIVRVKSVQL
jgi:hypothetical protein